MPVMHQVKLLAVRMQSWTKQTAIPTLTELTFQLPQDKNSKLQSKLEY